MFLSQTGYPSYKVLPRGLFLLAEIVKTSQTPFSMLLNHQNSLQIQKSFPAEESDVSSAGTRLLRAPQVSSWVSEKNAVLPALGEHTQLHQKARSMQSCSTSDPRWLPRWPTFPINKTAFSPICSYQKVTTCKPTSHLALVLLETSLTTQRDFGLPAPGV